MKYSVIIFTLGLISCQGNRSKPIETKIHKAEDSSFQDFYFVPEDNTFIATYHSIAMKVDSLVRIYKPTRESMLDTLTETISYEMAYLDPLRLASLSPKERVYYMIQYPESYSQNCNVIPLHSFSESKSTLLPYLSPYSESVPSSNRIEQFKRAKASYGPILDSMLFYMRHDTIALPRIILFYHHYNSRLLTSKLIALNEKLNEPYLASALFYTLMMDNPQSTIQCITGKKTTELYDHYYYFESAPLKYNKENVNKIIACAKEYIHRK